MNEATGTDRGDIIVSAMIEHLHERGVLLPASATLERIALAARALVRKRAHKSLVEGLTPEAVAGLEALIVVGDGQERALVSAGRVRDRQRERASGRPL